ncbi:hypothetical protein [Yoonia sp.]|uniref:lipopolysaccharide biosynthesis protein n=1 Tax=Yoonia sp. TaxID=2212373 RepID=UPI0019EA0CAD|nr:hypothetical protein [Yoonia sp.]MBE0412433.1 hypothetical protein [Yoonia sp.]
MRRWHVSGLVKGFAWSAFVWRLGIVGGNFGIMVGLVWWLGLAEFGNLMVLWGMALVAGTVMSVGAPVLILRVMTDGTGLRASGLIRLMCLYPVALAALAGGVLHMILPGPAWGAILLTGLAFNALQCLASVLRALGSVQMSMALRDGVPQLALGAAACLTGKAVGILIVAACAMGGVGLLVLLVCLLHPGLRTRLRASGDRGAVRGGLWANAVLGMATAQIDIVLAGGVLSADQIGIYALVRRIANLVALPVSVATWVSAPPIAAAFGAGDHVALRRASAVGSRIALLPGGAFFAVALLAMPLWPGLADARPLAVILLSGALVQVGLASGFTVATLCGLEKSAVLARLASLGVYLAIAFGAGGAATTTGNALAYLAGIIAGGALLWWLLWLRLQIDTSAFAVCAGPRGQRWKMP